MTWVILLLNTFGARQSGKGGTNTSREVARCRQVSLTYQRPSSLTSQSQLFTFAHTSRGVVCAKGVKDKLVLFLGRIGRTHTRIWFTMCWYTFHLLWFKIKRMQIRFPDCFGKQLHFLFLLLFSNNFIYIFSRMDPYFTHTHLFLPNWPSLSTVYLLDIVLNYKIHTEVFICGSHWPVSE